jgi:putative ABC transport system permease protein
MAAVILGISFLAGTLIFTDSVQRAFDELFATVFETTDAQVRASETVDAGFGIELRGRIDESVLQTVQAVDGVEVAAGFVQGTATVIGKDGEPVGNPGQGPPTFGFSWDDDPELNQFTIREGRAPAGPSDVVLDGNTADLGDYQVGDTVRVLTAAGSRDFELVGIAQFGESNSIGGATTALFDLETTQQLLGAVGELDAISVRAAPGISEEEIVEQISAELGEGVEAITGTEATEENQDAIAQGLSFFNIFLLAFAIIALFVSAFVIYNTFAILVAQRTRELALLRAIGASRGQVLTSVFVEALIVGLVGSLLGVGLGVALSFGLSAMLEAFGIELPSGGLVIQPSTVIVSVLVGTIVTLFSAVFPAVTASRITPIEALRESAAEPWNRNNVRFLTGLLITVLGGIAILFGLLQPELALAGVGIGTMFVGVFVLGPTIARPVSRVLGAPIARLRGTTGGIAQQNAMRNPKRTARTAAALMIGVALVAGVTVLASTLAATIEDTVGEQFTGDIAVDSGSFGPGGGFSPLLTAEIAEIDGVETAASLRVAIGEVEGEGDFIGVVDPAVAFDVLDVGITQGQPADLTDSTVFLFEDKAADLGLGLGDNLEIKFLDGTIRELTVAGVYSEAAFVGNYAITQGLSASTGAEQLEFVAYVRVADGFTIEEVRPAIDAAAADYPNVTVQDREEYIETQSASLDQLLGLIYGLLGLAVIIAAFGIANTLRLSVIERTHEIGLLRAVGMTQGQVRSTIRWEAVITALFGAVLGIVLGLFFGYAIVYALRDQGVTSFSVPIPALVVVVVLAALVGVVSAILPARRAARLDILESIASGE